MNSPDQPNEPAQPGEQTPPDLMRFNAILRMDMARKLGFEGPMSGIPEFLEKLNWRKHGVQQKAVQGYISRIVAIAHEEVIPESPPITVSWGSPITYTNKRSEAYEKQDEDGNRIDWSERGRVVEVVPYTPDPKKHDTIVRPQLRIMVRGEKDDEANGQKDTTKEQYVLTYTPAEYEDTPSEKTIAFLSRVADILRADLGIAVSRPEPHAIKDPGPIVLDGRNESLDIHSDGRLSTSQNFVKDYRSSKTRIIGSNMYAKEGVSMDLEMHSDTMHRALASILSKTEVSSSHARSWSKIVSGHDGGHEGRSGP